MSTAEKVRARRALVVGVIVVIAACGAYFGWHAWQKHEAASEDRQQAAALACPVTVAEVRKGDFPVYLNGLGTVQPFDTVTVRSRVDGEVIKVGFRQGQMVKEGDMLVEIDPRPYQAALDQAVAKKAQDEANLKNAQLNLERYNQLAKQDFASPPAARHRSRRPSSSSPRRSRATRRRSTTRRRRSATRPSARRSPAVPASAWSTPATTSTPPTPTAS